MGNWVGQTLGKVRIDKLLARGGTAEVYIGTHTTLHREVAIKILHSNYDEHPHALERFQREAMVVGKLRHPNIVQVFDFDTTTDSHPYLVMEYIKGPSLLQYLNSLHAKGKQLDFLHIVRLMNAMTSALQYAHDSGVVHRDIKPGNILLTSRSSDILLGKPLPADFEPVLTDFGLVRFIDSHQHTTGSGQIAGTPAYMSPEQARGDLTDGRTDIYSLGIVLYEMLAGHLPFDAETTMGLLMKHISEPPAPIPGLPPTMQVVIDRSLAKNLDERFQTPAEFAQAFTAAVENKNDFATLEMLNERPVPKPSKKLFGPARQRKWVAPAIGTVVILALGAAALFNGLPASSSSTATVTATLSATQPPSPSLTSTYTGTPPPSILLGRTGVLQFKNDTAIADQAVLFAEALLAPPEGTQYETWLVQGKERVSLGILSIDSFGKGKLIFTQAQGDNLLESYDGVEVTIEPSPDSDPKTTGIVAYSHTLPADALTHIRYLLISFPTTPDQKGLIQGLYADIQSIHELAQAMQAAADDGNSDDISSNAEAIQNIIVGELSQEHKDWNEDGTVQDPSDGFGLFLNVRNQGYLESVYAEAEAVSTSEDASKQMLSYAEGLKSSVLNLAQWTPELQNLVRAILSAATDEDIAQQVADTVALTEKMLNGIDLDQNGKIDPKPGEGGAQAAYDQTYHLADMPLEPVGILNLGTGTPTFISVPPTVTPGGGGNGGSGSVTQAPTQRVPPGQEKDPPGQDKKPTKQKKNNNGGGNGN